jgi:hypothetical protein
MDAFFARNRLHAFLAIDCAFEPAPRPRVRTPSPARPHPPPLRPPSLPRAPSGVGQAGGRA